MNRSRGATSHKEKKIIYKSYKQRRRCLEALRVTPSVRRVSLTIHYCTASIRRQLPLVAFCRYSFHTWGGVCTVRRWVMSVGSAQAVVMRMKRSMKGEGLPDVVMCWVSRPGK